jgi:SAM-dependent methyltransferase
MEMQSKNDFSGVWDDYASSIEWKPPSKREILSSNDLLIKFLLNSPEFKSRKKLKLLDAGSGIGQYVYYTKKLGFDSVGIDFSKKSVKIAKKLKNRVIFGDLRKLPFNDEEFDIVLAGGSLEHFPETEMAISEVNRVLKRKGLFIGNVPHRNGIYTLSKKIQQILGIWKSGYEKSFSFSKFRNILRRNGFGNIYIENGRISLGRHRFLSGAIRLVDEPFFLIGLGGAHFYFKCRKQ